MANRYRDTTIWNEDWYCNLGGEYMLLWDYICDNCDNAGVWKPNKIGFERSTGLKVSLDSFLKKVNGDKKRIIALENGRWFLPGFIKYQWFTKKDSFDLVLSIPHQLNLYNLLKANNINVLSLRGCQGVREGLPTRLVRYINTESINKNNDEVFEENNTDTEKKEKKEDENIFFENTNFLIPKMKEVWKNENPDYPDDKKKDFHALQNLAKFIFKQQGIKYDASDDSLCAQILKIWQELVLDIAKHDFFKNYSLLQVDKHIQNIIQNLKNGKSANTIKNTKGISRVGKTIEFDRP